MILDRRELSRDFERMFGRQPRIYRAPGRVNLIGEHTDYNDGFALPMALDRSTWIAAAPRADRKLVVHSRAYATTCTIDVAGEAPEPSPATHSWIDYLHGVAAMLETGGADMLIASDVPIGAGLSSSAALEIACGCALLDLADRPVDPGALARAAQRAEHEFVGTRCGLMDQLAACFGRADHALLVDTRSFEYRLVPIPSSIRVVVANTMVRHEHASGEYNARRADCEIGVRSLVRRFPAIRALRDVSIADLESARADLSDEVYRRCRHVVTENARTIDAVEALAAGNFESFGRLMGESHASLAGDYSVSCEELDTMVALAERLGGVYGARMTGGGFGGSIVALVEAAHAERVRDELGRHYADATGLEPDVWICRAGDGVEAIHASHISPL
jgi:galactokinase